MGMTMPVARKKPPPNFDIEAAISDFQSGMYEYKIAEKYNVSPATLSKMLIEAGAKHKRGSRFPPSFVQQVIREYQAGDGVQEIAERYRIHKSNVSRWLRLAGFNPLERKNVKIVKPKGRRKARPSR